MRRFVLFSFLSALLFSLIASHSLAQSTISEKTEGMQKYEGFFDYWWDDTTGKIWLEVDKLDQEFIYVNSLAAGIGSNDIGLDRSQLGNTRIVKFEKVGPKVLMVQPNYDYRATSDNPLEEKSINEAFAQSVLFGFEVAAQQDERILIDITDFLMQDAHGVAERLSDTDQGNYSVDASRSAIHLPGTFNFPKNSEFEVTLTFTGSGAGSWLRSVTPSPNAVTVRQHHSFVELPNDDYQPREFDPRSGFFTVDYQDYSAPIGGEFYKQYIVRHRLEKKNPEAEVSEPVEPIIYYLDNGTPEPVRSALLEGGRWWNQAFEEIGYENAFQVRILPDDAHPLDVRYNVINWVHRSTRGWSYGSSVVDPRTGEIIKGNVLLGSLRVRQDYLIAEGLLAPYEEGIEPDDKMLEMALARIRQLSAHEIGHTLGIAHNFAASTNDLSSVMDYPHPRATVLPDGSLSLEEAYDTDIGEWDKRTVAYGYQDFPDNVNEDEALEEIIQETLDMDLLYISDEAARPQSGIHPKAHLWDYGTDVIDQMNHILEIRQTALNNFDEEVIQMGRPMADLENALVPIYLYHRYQIEAVSKLIGGVNYAYNLRGDGQANPQIIDGDLQRDAVQSLIQTLRAETLALPENILDIIPPQPAQTPYSREHFRGYSNPMLDPVAMAEVAANQSATMIFNPERGARLTTQSARNPDLPGLMEVAEEVLNATILGEMNEGYHGSIQRGINMAVFRNLVGLASHENASPDAKAITKMVLENLQVSLTERIFEIDDPTWNAHFNYILDLIEQYKEDPESFSTPPAPYTPPGSPIGSGKTIEYGCGIFPEGIPLGNLR
ncbi:zinc-dependent metalloprotease [Rhodohalobacter sulfatireducens]|uniref:Zinc-dependent metalloprotease n=1 Tax=Rhodohalobacter sulfatireducens TaxID=2911366 RepID=A0ABS9KC83_9BACT|nr:zinc-dependent metalloprotease [Rhodohalobacter sulfatireducens]MCG2588463.1 zinc-dependent metalloprotease [Rhodohalobacter sulfatireducens]